jgi:hypothetical protein
MARIVSPVRFSDYFGIDSALLDRAGVLDPTLNVDTRLFIDPLLLDHSVHDEIKIGARNSYQQHFTTVIKLLRGSRSEGDAPWRGALRYLSFPEVKGTCLGYGAQTVSGSGSGSDMRDTVIRTGKQIVDLGVDDPDLFVAMALFEDGFGPDRISDMTTKVILSDLLKFNYRVFSELAVPLERRALRLRDGSTYDVSLPVNPFVRDGAPIILVPTDILRSLPVATDWSDVSDAASKNREIRNKVNTQIAELWQAKTLKSKSTLKSWALSGKDEFETLLKMIHSVKPASYDMQGDPDGELFWRKIAVTLPAHEPLTLTVPERLDLEGTARVVQQIIGQFRFLIEKRRLSEELYHAGKPRPEKAAQRLFFAVAYAYCKSNNLDITPEADTGNGPVDFKLSSGFTGRVLVEIKLSTNTKVVNGYSRQLETYKTAEETQRGYYVVIEVGGMGNKANQLLTLKNETVARASLPQRSFLWTGAGDHQRANSDEPI